MNVFCLESLSSKLMFLLSFSLSNSISFSFSISPLQICFTSLQPVTSVLHCNASLLLYFLILRTEIYSVHYRSFKLANMPVSSMKYFHLLISFTVAFIAVIMFFNSVSKSEKFSSLIPQNSTPSSPIFSPIKRIFPTMGHPCLSNS